MKIILLIFIGQFLYAILRTYSVRAISKGRIAATLIGNAASTLVRLLVLTGGTLAVLDTNYFAVAAYVIANVMGDWLVMRNADNKAMSLS